MAVVPSFATAWPAERWPRQSTHRVRRLCAESIRGLGMRRSGPKRFEDRYVTGWRDPVGIVSFGALVAACIGS